MSLTLLPLGVDTPFTPVCQPFTEAVAGGNWACLQELALLVQHCRGQAMVDFPEAHIQLLFQVYPTATRALGLGTCSGMARVGALITPFIAQVGVTPVEGGTSGPLGEPSAALWCKYLYSS